MTSWLEPNPMRSDPAPRGGSGCNPHSKCSTLRIGPCFTSLFTLPYRGGGAPGPAGTARRTLTRAARTRTRAGVRGGLAATVLWTLELAHTCIEKKRERAARAAN